MTRWNRAGSAYRDRCRLPNCTYYAVSRETEWCEYQESDLRARYRHGIHFPTGGRTCVNDRAFAETRCGGYLEQCAISVQRTNNVIPLFAGRWVGIWVHGGNDVGIAAKVLTQIHASISRISRSERFDSHVRCYRKRAQRRFRAWICGVIETICHFLREFR
jgi:hypothetical protein